METEESRTDTIGPGEKILILYILKRREQKLEKLMLWPVSVGFR